jgi:hypothetical protein
VAQRIPSNSFDAVVDYVGSRWRGLCIRGLLVLVVAIVPLAEASPPDPLWVGGMYDGADFDEVVAAVSAAICVMARPVSLLINPTEVVAEAVLRADRASLPTPLLPTGLVRAPPFSTVSADA